MKDMDETISDPMKALAALRKELGEEEIQTDEEETWAPRAAGDTVVGVVKEFFPGDKEWPAHVLIEDGGRLWRVPITSSDLKRAVQENEPSVGDLWGARYLGSGVTPTGVRYRRYAVRTKAV